jgi:hypothetical protein
MTRNAGTGCGWRRLAFHAGFNSPRTAASALTRTSVLSGMSASMAARRSSFLSATDVAIRMVTGRFRLGFGLIGIVLAIAIAILKRCRTVKHEPSMREFETLDRKVYSHIDKDQRWANT